MAVPALAPAGAHPELLSRLGQVCARAQDDGLAARLAELFALVREDLALFEDDLGVSGPGERVVQRSAGHLLSLGGKRLRPTCVMLASRLGSGFDARARDLAVAVELVHSATLLHDDVVDLGELRRGAPSARALYGNAASIFAGDWLLVEALRRVRRAAVPDTLDPLLDVIEEMIFAESLQLESRGRLDLDRERWLRVVEGKTASLFRWAMHAGARAGGLPDAQCAALRRYGTDLGVAFQAVDDVLDLTGTASETGKALFADLREGKLTWPLLLGLERAPDLRATVESLLAAPGAEPLLERRVLSTLEATAAIADTMALARERAASAAAALDAIPPGRPRDALVTVARAAVARRK